MTNPSRYLRQINVFIASPNDLNSERELFPKVLEKVNRIKAKPKGIVLEPVGWEDTLPGMGRPQEKINEDVVRSDLVVMLLWKRWGTNTGKYSSGFEEEYNVALDSRREIWMYFRAVSSDILADPGVQLKQVLAFRDRIETEKRLLFRMYDDEDNWREIFLDDLCKWLDRLPPDSPPDQPPRLPPDLVEPKIPHIEKVLHGISREIEKTEVHKKKIALDLARKAWELAGKSRFSEAEWYFSRAIDSYPGPEIYEEYSSFLKTIGAPSRAKTILLERENREYDVFICHASEDKVIARPLAEALRSRGLRVWYDGFSLTLGDNLAFSIDRGLANSRFGVVILSPSFFNKKWPQKELDGLIAQETAYSKVILPIWHKVDSDYVAHYSPVLAEILAISTDKGLDVIINEIAKVVSRRRLQHKNQ